MKKKEYSYIVRIEYAGIGIEAKNKKEAREKVKELFEENDNIELHDHEILEVEEVVR